MPGRAWMGRPDRICNFLYFCGAKAAFLSIFPLVNRINMHIIKSNFHFTDRAVQSADPAFF